MDEWIIPAEVTRVIDGDTLVLRCDLGFRVYSIQQLRLNGVDTAEIYGKNASSRGQVHKKFVEQWIDEAEGDWPFKLLSKRESGKYGRWIGDIQRKSDSEWLTDALVAEFPEVSRMRG